MWDATMTRIGEFEHLEQIDLYCENLRLLFLLNPVDALQRIEAQLVRIAVDGVDELLISVLSSLAAPLPCIKRLNPVREIDVLERLLRWAHRQIPLHVREHEGFYTPDVRDEAERARGSFASHLRSILRPEANAALLRLADEMGDTPAASWMRRSVFEHAVQAAELTVWKPAQVIEFENHHVSPISTPDDLFNLIDSILLDITRGFVAADASSRPILESARDEASVQEWLAEQLLLRSLSRYHVSRENQVADANRPDIVVSAIGSSFELAIEIKHGNMGWTLPELERGVREQLAHDYLRTPTRRFGFFILTAHRSRLWDHPEGGARIGFDEVLARLSDLAATLTTNATGRIRVKVVLLDARERPRQRAGSRDPRGRRGRGSPGGRHGGRR